MFRFLVGVLLLLTLLSLSAWSQDDGVIDEGFFKEGTEESTETKPELPQNMDSPPQTESPLFSNETDEPVELDQEPLPRIRREKETVDWDYRKGASRIRHPYAEKGLIRIKKDKTYVYRVPRSRQDSAFSFRFGTFQPKNLRNPETTSEFGDTYDESGAPIAFFEYEWQIFRGFLGKLGLKVGSGVFAATGHGQFANDYAENDGKTPKEVFTFVALPNSVGAIYRMQFTDRQLIVPYVDGGLMGITFFEFRDDQDFPKSGLSTAAFFSGGGALNLSVFDSLSMLNLDREYGINQIFLLAEFRQVLNLASDYDFQSSSINAGILVEF